MFERKSVINFLSMGAQKNRLNETVLYNIHNICFTFLVVKYKKSFSIFNNKLLSGDLHIEYIYFQHDKRITKALLLFCNENLSYRGHEYGPVHAPRDQGTRKQTKQDGLT